MGVHEEAFTEAVVYAEENEPLLIIKTTHATTTAPTMVLSNFGFGRCFGIVLVVLSSFALSLPPIFLKNLSSYDPFNPAFWGSIGMVSTAIGKLVYSLITTKTIQDLLQAVFPLNTLHKKISLVILLIRGPVIFGVTIFMFLAVENGAVGDVTAIMNSTPIPVIIISYFVFKEPFKVVHLISVILLLSGICVISKPEFIVGSKADSTNPSYLIGLAYSVIVLILNAVDNITLRYLRKIDLETIMLITGSLLGLLCIISVPIFSEFKLPQNSKEWISALGLISSFSVGSGLLALALKYEKSSIISFFQVLPVVLVYIWEVLFFNLVPDYISILGATLIISSVLLVSILEHLNYSSLQAASISPIEKLRPINIDEP